MAAGHGGARCTIRRLIHSVLGFKTVVLQLGSGLGLGFRYYEEGGLE
jgi:hypothetical protein